MKIHILHQTAYLYSAPVSFDQHILRIRPRQHHGILLESCSFKISVPHRVYWIRDPYENNLGVVDFTDEADELSIQAEFVIDTLEDNPFAFNIAPEALEYPFAYSADSALELGAFMQNIYISDCELLTEWMHGLWHSGSRVETLSLLQKINSHIYRSFTNQKRYSKGVQSPAETLIRKSGACRDLATLFIEACRLLGLAARFVSGYMYSPEITESMSMHGWAEVYLPGAGWIGFDPSWGILVDWHYIAVAAARHSEQAAPISGTYFGTHGNFLEMQVELYVKQIASIEEFSQIES